ncbi:hypothetical protein [Escherichia coli]|uniref:hypothetical protein n=1 Tax=Escherichia coli TaxID=562 RepID=UPI002035D817|nr:hypothetical protein [Escherichia coli]
MLLHRWSGDFINNERATFSQLNQPLTKLAWQGIASSPHSCALVVHDWSRLQFHSHHKKHDRLKMTHGRDVGYELQSSLLVDVASGLPVAPLIQTLTDSKGCRSTLTEGLSDSQTHMDALTADIIRGEALDTGKTLVHLIGREGDSVAHMRALSAQGLRWLIRGKEGHQSTYQGCSHKVGAVADNLVFGAGKLVDYKGRLACLSVAETPVTLTRVAKPKRTDKETGRRVKVLTDPPLAIRLSDSEHGVRTGMAAAAGRGREKYERTTLGEPVIGSATKAGANGKCPSASCRVIRITEHADVVVRVHAGRTDPFGDNRSGPFGDV